MPQITLNPTKDTGVNSPPGDTSSAFGSSYDIRWGDYSYNNLLVDFNWSQIPAGQKIDSATLYFYLEGTGYPAAGTAFSVSMQYCTSAWAESINGTQQPSYAGSRGSAFVFESGTIIASHIDVTGILQDMWNSGYRNGFVIRGAGGTNAAAWLYSKEQGNSLIPYIVINYSTANAPPNAPTITGPAANAIINTRTPTVTWNFSDPDAGNYQGWFLIQIVDAAYTYVQWDSGWIAGSQTSYTLPSGAIPSDASWYIRMRVQDQSGAVNVSNGRGPDPAFDNVLVTPDTVAPTIGGISPTAYSNTTTQRMSITGVADSGTGIDHVTAHILNYANTAWTTTNAVNAGGGTWYFDFNPAYEGTNGTHTVAFWVYDKAGNGTRSADSYIVYDTALPANANPTITRIGTTTIDLSWSAFSDPAPSSGFRDTAISVQSWSGTAWVTYTIPGLSADGYGNYITPAGTSCQVTGLTPGVKYRFLVAHQDKASNFGLWSWVTFTAKKQIGTYRGLKGNGTTISLPIYDIQPMLDNGAITAFSVKVTNGIGCFEIVPTTDQKASPYRVRHQGVTKSISLL